MSKEKKYLRIINQIENLIKKIDNPLSRMATINAILHFKMPGFFWTGFYLLNNGELLVGPYQGTLACLTLQKSTGVCWAGIERGKSVIVGNVDEFEGHIACSALTVSEIVIPLFDDRGVIVGVLDVDSKEENNFDDIDQKYLEEIVDMVYH
jgi:GAF domain-containing protein